MHRRILGFLAFMFAISTITLTEVQAAPSFEGKTIRIIVGNSPGGGYDRMARLFAKYLPQYIPGRPSVIVENMPGGATIVAANYIYNIAKPDGLAIGALGRGIPFSQLLKADGVKFDMKKFVWIGSTAVEATVFALRTDLPYKNIHDLIKAGAPIMVGSTGPAESSHQFSVLLKEFLGVNMKLISYPSSPEVMLAVERREVDGRSGSYSSLKSYIEKGMLRALVRGRVLEPGIENLPIDEDLTSNPVGKTIMALRSGPEKMGRPYVLPPKTPPELANILRAAFAKAAKDPAMKEEARKFLMEVEYVSGEECLKVSSYIIDQPEKIVKEVGKYIKF